MGYNVSYTGTVMDEIFDKSHKFEVNNEYWVLIPSTIKTLDISSLSRTGNYAYSGTISLPKMQQLYGFNTTADQEATTIDCSCLIFVNYVNGNRYQFITMHGIHEAVDKLMGIVWVRNTPKVFYANEFSNTILSIADSKENDKGIVKFDNQIHLFKDTNSIEYYDQLDSSYKELTTGIFGLSTSIYGDISNVFNGVNMYLDSLGNSDIVNHMDDSTIHVSTEEKTLYDNKYTSDDLDNDFGLFFNSFYDEKLYPSIDALINRSLPILNQSDYGNADLLMQDHLLDNEINWKITNISSRSWSSVCYGNGKFVAVSNTNYFAYSTDGITWTEGTISDTSRDWNSICYGNDKFVAVTNGNYFAYSTDGINWTESKISSSTIRYWRSVCYGNDKFVTVANDSNYFAYSTDGITWTEGTISSTRRYWQSVCYGNDKFVAVASNTNYFAYSTDGITWTESTISSTNRNWTSVCYGNDKFVAISKYNSYFAYSTDGITWTEGTISSTSRKWYSICYGNDKFVAVANTNYFAYSTDGINWTEGKTNNTDSTSKDWYSVCYGNGKFVAVGSHDETAGYIAYSVNATDNSLHPDVSNYEYWDSKAENPHTHLLDNRVSVNTDDVIGNITSDHISDLARERMTVVNTIDEMLALTSTDVQEGDWVFIKDESYPLLFVNDKCDYDSKEIQTYIVTGRLDTVFYSNGIYLTCDNTNHYLYRSTDGITWSRSDYATNNLSNINLKSFCYGNGKFVAVANSKYFYYSTNGINWTKSSISSTSRSWWSICYGNDKFVAVAYNSNYFAYSTDGINWTEGTISDTSRNWKSVCYGNDKFVAVANTNYFAYSTNGINWTEGTISSTSRSWQSVCYGNDKFVAVSNKSNYFAYSTNGINWTEGTISSTISSTSRSWYSVCYGNDKFVTVAYNTNYFAYSTNGINWTEGTISSTSRSWYSVCYGNDKFVAVADTNYFAYSTDGINWTEKLIIDQLQLSYTKWTAICYGNDKYVAVSDTNYFAYSTDGINWTEGTISSTSRDWRSVCYGNDKFVAVSGKYLAVSTDGINWNEINITNSNISWNNICYGNDKFVLVGYGSYGGASVKYSTDGITWGSSYSSLIAYRPSICYGNGVFVIIAYSRDYYSFETNLAYYSTDGINWISISMPALKNWTDVCYGNGKFVAVASRFSTNYFAYSSNGINWELINTGIYNKSWGSISYGDGFFVAMEGGFNNSSGNYLALSADGINWTEGKISDTSRTWMDICYGNGKYVAVSWESEYFATISVYLGYTKLTPDNINLDWSNVINKPTTITDLNIIDHMGNSQVDILNTKMNTTLNETSESEQAAIDLYKFNTDDRIRSTHNLETQIDDTDQKLKALIDMTNTSWEIVATFSDMLS